MATLFRRNQPIPCITAASDLPRGTGPTPVDVSLAALAVARRRRDTDTVHNGNALPWSRGPVQGSIRHPKTIQHSVYGPGGHDLLYRRAILHLPD